MMFMFQKNIINYKIPLPEFIQNNHDLSSKIDQKIKKHPKETWREGSFNLNYKIKE